MRLFTLQNDTAQVANHAQADGGALSGSELSGACSGENHIDIAAAGRHTNLFDVAGWNQSHFINITVRVFAELRFA